MAIKCPRCGNDSEDEARFCNSCGAAIDGPAASASGPSMEPVTGMPAFTPPPAKKSKVWLWVTLSVVGGLMMLGLLYTIFFSARVEPYKAPCLDQLRTIDSAIMQYAAANNGVYPNGTADLEGTYVRAPFPRCTQPKTKDYTYSDPGTPRIRTVCPNGHTY